MSYCLNPQCQKPHNPSNNRFCQHCGAQLLLEERYRAVKLIGKGGFGRTFLAFAQDLPSEPPCVIKQFLPELLTGSEIDKAKELFAQEARQLEQLGQHPQIPQLLAHFSQEEHLYLVQEFIDGQNLAAELAQEGPFDQDDIKQVLESLLPVLEFVHQQQVIHRDIKPENIIRRSLDRQLVLVDFGAAKLANNAILAKTGTIIGTPGYSSPEQAMGKAIFASDIYSLGVTCLHLLTQIEPLELFDTHENDWAWEHYLTTPMTPQLKAILNKMVAMGTKKRYQSATEILRDLAGVRIPTTTSPQTLLKFLPRLVEIDQKYGYINPEGKMIISLQFDKARHFQKEGLAAVKIGRQWGFITPEGNRQILPQFDDVGDFSEGLAPFKLYKWYWLQSKWGYINTAGEIVIEPQFCEASDFRSGLAAVRLGISWGYIDTQGNMIIEPKFDEACSFQEGLARVRINSKWGYIDNTGEVVIPPRDNGRNFSTELAAVEINRRWGYINSQGILVIQPQYQAALDFSEGLAPVLMETRFLGLLITGEKWGYINKLGIIEIEPQFDWAYSFSEGLAPVKRNNQWGYVNKLGQVIIEPRFDFAAGFIDGLAEVILGGQCRYINKRGNLIY
ncbi:WG repeat-containing protein [Gloeocapsa sp. PCC 73106]|uniref:WG repeat-containing protein n=1 Tax=Gloeocapsa sp. PCC 73106 TaxID=102232 RepID=UPI0002ACBA0A|nr:WG repeat-containing protein [Gloeocapsa sp. PCC 73106]ELR97539.1 serine/threonine protein kinase [Gloeocapsa sp. PCC 73106]